MRCMKHEWKSLRCANSAISILAVRWIVVVEVVIVVVVVEDSQNLRHSKPFYRTIKID